MEVKHLLMTALAVAGISSASAQIADGDYYIQNVESGLFLCGANSWGTQGTVGPQGEMFTVALNNGTYTLTNKVVTAGNKTFGYNLYVDSNTAENGNAWTIAPVDGKDGVYTIYGNGKLSKDKTFDGYLSQSDTKGNHIGFAAGSVNPADATAEWRFLTKEEAIAQLKTVTWGNSMNASFLLENPNFSRNHSTAAWVVSSNCTNKNLGDGEKGNFCAESYHSPFTISQTIDVPNGVYGVTAQGFVRDDDGGNVAEAVFFANEVTTPFPVKNGTENTMPDASNSFKTGAYPIDEFKVTVTNGKLEVGVKNTSGSLWCIWDNFQLTYYGIDVTALQEALEAKITAAEAITGDMNASIASALETAITNAKACAATEDELTAALAELTQAIDNATASAAQYADVAAKLAGLDATGKASFNASASGVKYAAKTLVVADDITTDYIAAVKAQDTPGADFTALIVNPQVNGKDGWTCDRPKGGNGPLLGGVAFEYWGGNANPRAEAAFDYYQVIEGVPNGKYRISADMYNSLNGEAGATWAASTGLYANTESVLVDVEGQQYNNYSVEVAVTGGTLRIGVKNFSQLAARWFCADNFTLTLVEAISLEDYYNSIATLLTQANAITGKQTASVATALASAISATEGYTSVTDTEALQTMIEDLTTATENSTASVNAYVALQNALAKTYLADRSDVFGTEFTYRAEAEAMYEAATAATADVLAKANGMLNEYRAYVRGIAGEYTAVEGVKSARENSAWEYTTNPQNNGALNNPGNMDVTGNSMWENWNPNNLTVGDMKQTVKGLANGKYFLKMVSYTRKSVNENDYIYIKSGSEEAKALSLGDAATKNGFINITDPIIVTNGEVEIGLHVGSGCDWAVIGGVALYKYADAATMTVNADAQYGTFVAPFDVTIPDGVTAYTVKSVGANDVLDLTEVETTIPANTPVILNAEEGFAATTFYGKAVAGTPTNGLLTGVYETTEVAAGSYILLNQNDVVGFYLVDDHENYTNVPKVGPNRCYLTVPAGTKARVLSFDGDATGIQNVEVADDAAMYNVSGVRVNSNYKGIVIKGGKKYIVK